MEVNSNLDFDLSISLFENQYLIKVGGNNQKFWNRNLNSIGGYFDSEKSAWVVPFEKSTTEKIELILHLANTNVLFRNDIILISEELMEVFKN